MAVQWLIRTNATPDQVVRAFEAAFFSPRKAKFSDRFKLADPVARNSSLKIAWRKASVEGATIAAAVESAGALTEMMNNSSHGAGSIIGSKIGMSVKNTNGATKVQLWQAEYRSQFGISQLGQVLKGKVVEIARQLEASGALAEVSKA